MKKTVFLLVGLVLAIGLLACGSPTPEATPTQSEPSATPAPANTPTPLAATDTPAPTRVSTVARPAPTPTTPWMIPEVQPDDWIIGGEDAGLVLVEYSDFQ